MQQLPGQEGEFEKFRRERQKRRQQNAEPARRFDGNDALREIERVERKEMQDRQLTRDVHDFFASATQTAASIMEKVAHTAKTEATERLTGEMEEFLLDACRRMNTLVADVVGHARGRVAEERVEAQVHNIVGQPLDGFRSAGTANLADRHLGQDPFEVDVEAVCREFRELLGKREVAPPVPVDAAADAPAPPDEVPAPAPEARAEPAGAAAPATPTAVATRAPVAAAPVATANRAAQVDAELRKFQATLKQLVRDGTMTREEARAAWQTRVQALRKGAGAPA